MGNNIVNCLVLINNLHSVKFSWPVSYSLNIVYFYIIFDQTGFFFQSLDSLEKMVRESFSKVPNK